MLRKFAGSAGAALLLAFAGTSPAAAVVGGNAATPGAAPYQVSVSVTGLYGWSHVCGGVLRDANTVITAAHCVDGQTAGSVSVRYGGTDRTELPMVSAVKGKTMHPGYNSLTMANDVALIKLSAPVVESATVKFIPLASTAPTPGTQVTVTGWGKLAKTDTSLPRQLQTVQLPVNTPDTCKSADGGLNLNLPGGTENGGLLSGVTPVYDSTSMFCAGPPAGGKGFCLGDGGGPAVAGGVLVGIVSWSEGCARDGSPGVYSDVAHFRNWLSQ